MKPSCYPQGIAPPHGAPTTFRQIFKRLIVLELVKSAGGLILLGIFLFYTLDLSSPEIYSEFCNKKIAETVFGNIIGTSIESWVNKHASEVRSRNRI
jgi:hypothetical protein